jgi:single-strand DNA-binding protein
MSGFNQVLILGRLTAKPEQLKTKARKMFIKATIATSVYRKPQDGVNEEHTSFIPVTVSARPRSCSLNTSTKVTWVHVTGRLESNKWRREDGKRECDPLLHEKILAGMR